MRVIDEQTTLLRTFGTDEISWRVVEYVKQANNLVTAITSVRLDCLMFHSASRNGLRWKRFSPPLCWFAVSTVRRDDFPVFVLRPVCILIAIPGSKRVGVSQIQNRRLSLTGVQLYGVQ